MSEQEQEQEHDLLKTAREWMKKMDQLFQRYPEDSLLASIDQFFQSRRIPTYVKNTEKEWIVTFQIPGITKDRIKLSIVDNHLVVVVKELETKGIKDPETAFHHLKQFESSRESAVQLPATVIPSTLVASYEHGLLKVKAKKQAIQRRDLTID